MITTLDFSSLITERSRGFIGREWVFVELDRWLDTPDAPHYFIITGEPGIGKSSIAAWLTQIRDVAAHHFCIARQADTLDPLNFARSLSLQLTQLDLFARQILEEKAITLNVNISVKENYGQIVGVEIQSLIIEDQSATVAFNRVVVDPLKRLYASGFDQQLIVLVDALDEATQFPGRESIVDLLASARSLPSQVRFVLTTRPESVALRHFEAFHIPHLVLDARREENLQDVRKYVLHKLEESETSKLLEARLAGQQMPSEVFIDRVTSASQGNFLFLSWLLPAIANGTQEFDRLATLPVGLDGIYLEFLRTRKVGKDIGRWRDYYRPLLGVLATAQAPLKMEQLAHFVGMSHQDARDILFDVQQFLEPVGAARDEYQLYHQSVVEFLSSEERAKEFWIDLSSIHGQIAVYYQEQYAHHWSECDLYGLGHLPTHLVEAGQVGDLISLLMDLDFIEAKCFANLAVTLLQDYSITLVKFPEIAQQPNTLKAIKDFQGFVRSHLHVLSTYPELTFQQALNQPEDSEVWRTVQVSHKRELDTKPYFQLKNKHYDPSPINLVLQGHRGAIRECMWSPTGGEIITAAEDGLRIWDSETGQLKRHFSEQTNLVNCKYSPDGNHILSARYQGLVIRNAASGKTIWDVEIMNIAECAWSPDGTRIVLGHYSPPKIEVWGVDKREHMRTFKLDLSIPGWDANDRKLATKLGYEALPGWVYCTWSPDGTRILFMSNVVNPGIWSPDRDEAIICKDQVLGNQGIWAPDGHAVLTEGLLWGAMDGVPIKRLSYGRPCDWSTDGNKLAVVENYSNNVEIWNAKQLEKEFDLVGHTDHVTTCAFSPDGTLVLTCSEDTTLRIWDATTGDLVEVLQGHTGAVDGGQWSPNGKKILSRSEDRTCRIWDLAAKSAQLTKPYSKKIQTCLFSPSGTKCLISAWKGKTEIWNMQTIKPSYALPVREVVDCGWSPDEKSLYTIIEGGDSIDLWDPVVGEKQLELRRHYAVERAWIGPEMVVSGGFDDNLRLWERRTGKLVQTLMGHMDEIQSIAGSPDGKMIASGSRDGTVCLWQLESAIRIGGPTYILRGTKDPIKQCQWSPDAKYLVSFSGSKDRYDVIKDLALRLWDARSGQLIATLNGHTAEVVGCAWSPDGSRLVSGAKDGTLRIWDGKDGKSKQTIRAHDAGVIGCCWSLDGRKIISVSEDLRLRIWDAESGECIASFFAGGMPTQFSLHNNSRDLVLGTEGGGIFFLEMKNVDCGVPIITPVAADVSGGSDSEGSLKLRCIFCGCIFPIRNAILGKSLACIKCGERLMVNDQVCEPLGPSSEDSVALALRNLEEYGKTLENELEMYRGQSRIQQYHLQVMDSNLEKFVNKIIELPQMYWEIGDQQVQSQQPEIRSGNIWGRGKYAIIALVITIILYLVVRLLFNI